MQKYKGIVEYVGTNYCGMQRQESLATIQGAIEKALTQFTNGKSTQIDYCGRTDAGVHAFGQVIHFEVESLLSEEKVLLGINFFLNKNHEQVALKFVEKVDDTFHSRFSCVGREYKYYIYNSRIKSPIFEGKMHHVVPKIDILKMRESAKYLLGEHNFTSFRGKNCQALSPIRTVEFINITQIQEDIIEIHVGARSFLYRMVRNITGALIYAGIGKIQPEFVGEILEKKDRSALPYTAPACGLYFFKAKY